MFALCLAAVLLTAGGEQPVTAQNQQTHPKTAAVRAVVDDIQAARAKRTLKVTRRLFGDCPDNDAERAIFKDEKGRVRLYVHSRASEQEVVGFEYFYDLAGRRRMLLVKANRADGAELDHRIYFDEKGKRVAEVREVKGKDVRWPEKWPEEQLVADPQKAFDEKSGCKGTEVEEGA